MKNLEIWIPQQIMDERVYLFAYFQNMSANLKATSLDQSQFFYNRKGVI